MFWLVCDNGMGVIRTIGVTKTLLVAVFLCASCGGSSAPPLEAAASVISAEEASDSLGFAVGRYCAIEACDKRCHLCYTGIGQSWG